jgi:methylmalonyl-CoA mutase
MMPLELDSFSPTSFDEWKKLVSKELGERPFDSLVWNTPLGFAMQPYYAGGVRATSARTASNWEIGQAFSGLPETVNEQVLEALQGGVEALFVNAQANDLHRCFDGVFLDIISSHLRTSDQPLVLLDRWKELVLSKGYTIETIRGSLQTSAPIHLWSEETWAKVAEWSKQHLRLFRPLVINANQVHEWGGHAVHELAYALASAQECTAFFIENGYSIDDVSAWFQVNTSCGNAYFIEIAKLRAIRQLWSTFVQAYEPQHACSKQLFIHAEGSLYLQTGNDAYTNLLRSTTQAMSAIVGGADSCTVQPFDASFREPTTSSLRWARNIQHLLREESYFDQLTDAGSGSFYIEELTKQLGEQAWKLFQEIEKRGGLKSAEPWFIEQVKLHASQQQEAVLKGERIVIGVNKYAAKGEQVPTSLSTARLSHLAEQKLNVQTLSQS